ncbi:MAG: hypothetical protein AB1411_06345 [Nitrospirota bacterium]
MAGGPVMKKRRATAVARRDGLAPSVVKSVLWRLDRLERQVRTLSELVRKHAEDADRLVRIVGEDHEALRKELLREHQARLRVRKRARATGAGIGLLR